MRTPHIVAVGMHRINGILHELAPGYVTRARIKIIHEGFDAAVSAIHALGQTQPIDVLVAAGSNGAYLRQQIDIPLVLVRVGGFDVLSALGRARRISSRIALVTHGHVSPALEHFNSLFQLNVEQHSYRTAEEARHCVQELRARGIEVVVAPGLVSDLAEAAGLTSILLYSQEAVREALEDAIELARLSRLETARRERLNTILAQLRDGVVAVNLREQIEVVNPAMERLLQMRAEDLLGRKLSDISPGLSLAATVRGQETAADQPQNIGTRAGLVNRSLITENGLPAGAVLTFQDSDSIHRVDRTLRAYRHRPSAQVRYRLSDILGASPKIAQARRLAGQFASSDSTVLIVGESGTGKELFAQGIHAQSGRSKQPFIAVNCAAFPEGLLESELFGYVDGAFTGARKGGKLGLFEAAHTGTLFLDELGEMPVSLQTRLLRVLQEREIIRIGAIEPTSVDVRVIAATHRDLQERIACGAFRKDLYYRLNILRLRLPSLRERRQDIPQLAAHFSARARSHTKSSLPDAALARTLLRWSAKYDWPGNIRELENMIERLASLGISDGRVDDIDELKTLLPELFAEDPEHGPFNPRRKRRDPDRLMIEQTLTACGNSTKLACARLGISRTTLWRRLKSAN